MQNIGLYISFSEIIKQMHESLFGGKGMEVVGMFKYVEYIIIYTLPLAVIFMIILVGTKVMKYFANPSDTLDPYVLVRPILVIAALVLYKPLIKTLLIKPAEIIEEIALEGGMFIIGSKNPDEFRKKYKAAMTHIQGSNDEKDKSVYDVLQVHWFLELIHIVIMFVGSVASGYIMLRQVIYKAIYLILGTLVLPLSLIPGNDGVVKRWFLSFFSILMWIPLLTIMQTIIIMIQRVVLVSGGFQQVLMSIALQVVMIYAILRVPSYANILVSPENGASSGSGFGGSSYAKRIGASARKHTVSPAYDRVIGKRVSKGYDKVFGERK